jgi:hypothetical protein
LGVDGIDIVRPKGHIRAVRCLLMDRTMDDQGSQFPPGETLIIRSQLQKGGGIPQAVPLDGSAKPGTPMPGSPKDGNASA